MAAKKTVSMEIKTLRDSLKKFTAECSLKLRELEKKHKEEVAAHKAVTSRNTKKIGIELARYEDAKKLRIKKARAKKAKAEKERIKKIADARERAFHNAYIKDRIWSPVDYER